VGFKVHHKLQQWQASLRDKWTQRSKMLFTKTIKRKKNHYDKELGELPQLNPSLSKYFFRLFVHGIRLRIDDFFDAALHDLDAASQARTAKTKCNQRPKKNCRRGNQSRVLCPKDLLIEMNGNGRR
jgi:hypothetical protein